VLTLPLSLLLPPLCDECRFKTNCCSIVFSMWPGSRAVLERYLEEDNKFGAKSLALQV
jgi:hypothetical protein